jgi:hypothetical protein
MRKFDDSATDILFFS